MMKAGILSVLLQYFYRQLYENLVSLGSGLLMPDSCLFLPAVFVIIEDILSTYNLAFSSTVLSAPAPEHRTAQA